MYITTLSFISLQGDDRFKFEELNPFIGEDEIEKMASVGYRYRKWDLDNGIVLVARCQHDAVMHGVNGEVQFINVKALNEWDPRVIFFFLIRFYEFCWGIYFNVFSCDVFH